MRIVLKNKLLLKEKTLWIGSIIFLCFVILRVLFIQRFPLFTDEAIYIHWAQYIRDDFLWKFISLSDGKQPLFIWLISIFLSLFHDPVIASRMISVLAGGCNMLGLYLIGKNIFSKHVGFIAIIFYVFTPFYLVYDGLALMDNLLLTESIFSTLFLIKMSRSLNYRYGIYAGLFIGLGLLTKSSANFFLYSLPFFLFFLPKINRKNFYLFTLRCVLAISIAKSMELILRLSSDYAVIETKNSVFIYTFQEFLQNPFSIILHNVPLIASWMNGYMGIILLLLALFSLLIRVKRTRVHFLFVYALFPILTMTVFGKQLFPRHFLFMTWPLLLLAAQSIMHIYTTKLSKKVYLVLMCVVVLLQSLMIDAKLLFNPLQAQIPFLDRIQLLDGEPSGWGITTLVSYFSKFKKEQVLVFTDKSLGILPDGLAIYFPMHGNITVVGADSVSKESLQFAINDMVHKPDVVYIILSWQGVPANMHLEKVFEIKRPGTSNKNWTVYKVLQ